ncbi:hypothetical protein E2562_015427 [Oryza meyeriana var. granulata]|uniref:Serine carboxypeptidase-like 18 n=1 Tax=Oryza meyeriana var. granulata TaxID=110450 RepID=A0A6G1BXH0_9ORYZ|nr:hypothetical protein E2562_015427 [Oryza meyeriana var. granulata]
MATRLAQCCLLLLLCFCSPAAAVVAPAAAMSSRKAVDRLPGFSGPLPFSLETGYVAVGEARFFYYFIQSERSPEEDPVLLWLTGGPGCSAFSGLVYEIGPFFFDFHGYKGGLPTLLYKADSWTKVSNVIFVDSPPGTGFSYATTAQGFKSSDTIVVHQLYAFLQKWFDDHPQFSSNPLYISGDSYSGIIIPTLTMEIAKGIESSDKRRLNLKGYIAGNPLTDAPHDHNSRFPFLHGMGIIDDELYEIARKSCMGEYNNPLNSQCANSVQAIWDCIRDVNDVHILEPRCEEEGSPISDNLASQDRRSKLLESAVWSICRNATYVLSKIWANDEGVRESLGIHKGTVTTWKRCNYDVPYTKEIVSTVEYHLSLITQGYRGLVYSGDHDSKISVVGTQGWLRSLNLSITDDWRPWYVNSQVVGFTRTYSNNLTYATVKVCGGYLHAVLLSVIEFMI